jgi:hypothetical protein
VLPGGRIKGGSMLRRSADRQVNLSGGRVYGKVIAEQLALTSGGQIISQ